MIEGNAVGDFVYEQKDGMFWLGPIRISPIRQQQELVKDLLCYCFARSPLPLMLKLEPHQKMIGLLARKMGFQSVENQGPSPILMTRSGLKSNYGNSEM